MGPKGTVLPSPEVLLCMEWHEEHPQIALSQHEHLQLCQGGWQGQTLSMSTALPPALAFASTVASCQRALVLHKAGAAGLPFGKAAALTALVPWCFRSAGDSRALEVKYLVATHHLGLQEGCLHQLLKPSRIWEEGC